MLSRAMRLAIAAMLALVLVGGVVGRAAAAPIAPEKSHPAVAVVVVPKLSTDSSVVYELRAINHGDQFAANTEISVPFNAAMLKFTGVEFRDEAGWLKENGANMLLVRIERLNNRATATLHFAKLPGAPSDAGLVERATVSWTFHGKSWAARSNMPERIATASYPLAVSVFNNIDKPMVRFTGGLFVPGEPVVFWCNMPDGTTHPLVINEGPVAVMKTMVTDDEQKAHKYGEYIRADADGGISLDLGAYKLDPGFYSVVAYGHWTEMQAIGGFEVK